MGHLLTSDSIHQPLNMYAVMASAAGVGMLALSHPAEAKIVSTPAHTLIDSGQTAPLDLNHDGKADFSFQNYSNTFEGSEQGFFTVITAQAKNAVDGEAVYDRALALKAGTRVGAKARFISLHSISMVSADAAERCFQNWSNVKNRYLGLRFVAKQQTHFGGEQQNQCRSRMTWATSHNQVQRLSAHPHIHGPVWGC